MDTDQTDTASSATATTDAVDTSTATPSSEPTGASALPDADAAAQAAATPIDATAALPGSSLASDTRSAITSKTQGQPAAAPQENAAPPVDWEKRFKDLETYTQRVARERTELRNYRQQWGDLDPQTVRQQLQAQQAEADKHKLKAWHPGHPESDRTMQRLHRAESYKASRDALLSDPAIAQMDEKSQARLLQNLAAQQGVQQDDLKLLNEFEQTTREERRQYDRDPRGYIGQIVREEATRIAQQQVQEYDQYRNMSMATEQWMQDPQRAELLTKHREAVLWAMDDKTPRREVGVTIAALAAEVQALKAKLGADRETVETAAAQKAAVTQRATVRRDPNTTRPITDPVDEGLKSNLTGVQLIEHLRARRANDQ